MQFCFYLTNWHLLTEWRIDDVIVRINLESVYLIVSLECVNGSEFYTRIFYLFSFLRQLIRPQFCIVCKKLFLQENEQSLKSLFLELDFLQ